MVIAALLLLLATAAPEDERGLAGAPDESVWERKDPSPPVIPVTAETEQARLSARYRAGLGAALLGGFSYYEGSGGAGVTLDVGILLRDRLAVFLHGEVGSLIVTLIGSVALVTELVIAERFSVGLGGAFTAWAPTGNIGSARYTGLTFPVRLSYALRARASDATRRSGLLLCFQIAPGVSLIPRNPFDQPGPIPPQASITSTVSVGYALW